VPKGRPISISPPIEEDEFDSLSNSYIIVYVSPNIELELLVCSQVHSKDVVLMLKASRSSFPQLNNNGEVVALLMHVVH